MKRYLQWALIGFEIILIASLLSGIKQSRATKSRVEQLVEEKKVLMKEREEMLTRLEYVQGADYLEKVARDELNLSRPGETVIIVPRESEELLAIGGQEVEKDLKNWEKWLLVLVAESTGVEPVIPYGN